MTKAGALRRKRRSSKEPEVAADSPFAPVIALARSQIRALSATVAPEDEGEIAAGLRGRIEGMETILVLCQRAGAGEKLEGGQHLVQLARAPIEEDPGVLRRLADLERHVAELEVFARGGAKPNLRAVPPILQTPTKASPASSPRPRTSSTPREKPYDGPPESPVGDYERRLLRVLAQRRGQGTTDEQLAILAERSIESSSFTRALSVLRAEGFIEGTNKDLRSTPAGEEYIGPIFGLPEGKELLAHWCARLEKYEATMLEALCEVYPVGLDREGLGERTGYSVTSSSFDASLRKLRSLKLATEGWPTKAAEIFFEGARLR